MAVTKPAAISSPETEPTPTTSTPDVKPPSTEAERIKPPPHIGPTILTPPVQRKPRLSGPPPVRPDPSTLTPVTPDRPTPRLRPPKSKPTEGAGVRLLGRQYFGRDEPVITAPTSSPKRTPRPSVPEPSRNIFSRGRDLFVGGYGRTKEGVQSLVPTEEDPWIEVSPQRAESVQKWTRRGFSWAPGGGTGISVGEHVKEGTIFTPRAARDVGISAGLDALFFAPMAGPIASAGLKTGVKTGKLVSPSATRSNISQVLGMNVLSLRQARQVPGQLWRGVRHPREGAKSLWQSELMMPIRQPRETVRQLYGIGTGRTRLSPTSPTTASAATQAIPESSSPSPGAGPGPGLSPPPRPGPGPGPRPSSGPRPDFGGYGTPFKSRPPVGGNGGRVGQYTEAFGDPMGPIRGGTQYANILAGRSTPITQAVAQEAGGVSTLTRPTTGISVGVTEAAPLAPTIPGRPTLPPFRPGTRPYDPFRPGPMRPYRPSVQPQTPTRPSPRPSPSTEPALPGRPGPRPAPGTRPVVPRVEPGPRPAPRIRTFPRVQPIGPFPATDPRTSPATATDLETQRQRSDPSRRTGTGTGTQIGTGPGTRPGTGTGEDFQEDLDIIGGPGPLPGVGPITWGDGYVPPPPPPPPPPEEGGPPRNGDGGPPGEGGGGMILPPFPWLPGAPIGLGTAGGGRGAYGRATDPFGYRLRGELVRQIDPFSGEVVGTRRVGARRLRAGRAAPGSQRRTVPTAQAGRLRGV